MKEKLKPRISSNTWTAIMATIVSICALAVSSYQAYIQHQQQEASVWPFLQVDISQTDSDLKNEHEFYYTLINKGVGPAIIDSCTVILNDTMYQGMSDLISQKLKRKKFKGTFGYVDIYPSRIIAQGEQLNLAGAQGNDIKDSMINLIQDASFRMMIRYHSIYQRQWQLNINYHHSPPLQTIELKD